MRGYSQPSGKTVTALRIDGAKKISVIFPVYNEEDNINHLVTALFSVLPKLTPNFEIIAVNDGSTDHSYEHLYALAFRILMIPRSGKYYASTTWEILRSGVRYYSMLPASFQQWD